MLGCKAGKRQGMIFESDGIQYQTVQEDGASDYPAYVEIVELGGLKPKPVLFAYRCKQSGKVLVSIHREGLPFEMLRKFTNYVEKILCEGEQPN